MRTLHIGHPAEYAMHVLLDIAIVAAAVAAVLILAEAVIWLRRRRSRTLRPERQADASKRGVRR